MTSAAPSNSSLPETEGHKGVDRTPQRIRRMFSDIAPSYDFLNHVLSANRDRAWRRRTVELCALQPHERVLDACCGTGDLAFEARRRLDHRLGGRVVGTDFCPEMVRIAGTKDSRRSDESAPLGLAVADTLALPFADASFEVVTVGFGIRNVSDLDAGLAELYRVLRPEGRLAILEFTTPKSKWFRKLFSLYFNHVLPRLGRSLSAAPDPDLDDAYRYLPASVSLFPRPEELRKRMEAIGFRDTHWHPLTLGIAAVHIGHRR